MQIQERMNAIRQRAEVINLSLAVVCREADVHLSTITRWEHEKVEPKNSTVRRIVERLEAVLDRHEARIWQQLSARPPPLLMAV
jgi:predicted transcriptional regulator